MPRITFIGCPTIVYVSRVRKAMDIAGKLSDDGYQALPYHGKMESRQKTMNQNAFMEGEVDIMVATSAFGMGVDKDNVGMVVHYDISDSLKNYVKNHFESIKQRGTYYITPERMEAYNFDIVFRDKRKNINGLQLADLAAYPIARYVNDKERANPAFDIIKPKIYNKGTKLYGLKEFP